MKKFRWKVRREVSVVNNPDALTPMERITYGIVDYLKNRESAIIRAQEEQEKEFIRNAELVKDYIVFIKGECIKVFNQERGATVLFLLDKEVLPVLPQILKNKKLKGYELKTGYVDEIIMKTKKNVRIPLYVTDKVA